MENFNFIIICIIGIFSMDSCSNNEKVSSGVTTIVFDSEKSVGRYYIDQMLDTTFRIVPLATDNDYLISKIDKLEMVDGKFYIMDRMAQSIFIFNADGSYVGKINKYGRGPGEYTHLSYMTVTDSNIIVMDHIGGKQIIYDRVSLNTVSEDPNIYNQIWCTDLFVYGDVIYYINDWSNSQSGKYLLFSKVSGENIYSKHLSFKEEPNVLGINGPTYGLSKDDALLIFSGDDHIYRISGDNADAKYLVEFKDKKAVYNSSPEKVFQDNKGQNVVLGMNKIQQSGKYIFCEVTFTNEDLKFIYDKESDSVTIYKHAIDSNFSDNLAIYAKKVIDSKIINWYEANFLSLSYQSKQDKTPKTRFEKELYGLVRNLPHDANPVLFIYNLKQ